MKNMEKDEPVIRRDPFLFLYFGKILYRLLIILRIIFLNYNDVHQSRESGISAFMS